MIAFIARSRIHIAAQGGAVAFCFAVSILGSLARAQTTLIGAVSNKPAKVDSFISTSDGGFLWDAPTTIANATDFPAAMNAFPGPTVDVLMQQCFGGGFASGVSRAITNNTFTAATNWNELAINTPTGDNFTSSWNASFPRNEGLYQHYADARNGATAITPPNPRPAVTPDPYGPLGASRTGKYFEDPIFASPDATIFGNNANPAGANNARDIVTNNQYAVLMAPQPQTNGADTPRFGVNIDRIYNSLLSIQIPANHIIVLYGSNNPNTRTPGGTPINGPASLANIIKATGNGAGLYGDINGQMAPGNPPNTSHLFVYTTGHGNSWDQRGALARATRPTNPVTGGDVDVTVDDLPSNNFLDVNGSDSGIGTIDLQLYSQASDLSGTSITLDGSTAGTLLPDPAPDNSLIGIIASQYAYDVQVPLSQINSLLGSSSPLDIGVGNLSDSDSSDGLISAVSFDDYGDVWSVGVVPEPASLGLLILGGIGLFARCRRA